MPPSLVSARRRFSGSRENFLECKIHLLAVVEIIFGHEGTQSPGSIIKMKIVSLMVEILIHNYGMFL